MTQDTLTFIGTATVLLEINGKRILTDPVFFHGAEKVHMGWGLFSKRKIKPALSIADLPPLDLILVSHTHNDHWDKTAQKNLDKSIPVITTTRDVSKIKSQGFSDIRGLEVGSSIDIFGITIEALPAQHGPLLMTPFTGKVIGFGLTYDDKRLWISGDTIGIKSLKQALHRFAPQVGIMYFGAVRYIARLTFNGKDAVSVVNPLESLKKGYAVHYDDWTHFKTSQEDIEADFQAMDRE
ncbi:MAG: MBL fold metallo-hydrolase, partial [Candidatus Heimdallarchaeota archaeon]|nr:MBL fold metallo-hydrolase [Candidatus Heimdallarchaeota archaeon]